MTVRLVPALITMTLGLALANLPAFAKDEQKDADFEKQKQEILGNIETQIASLQENKTCISAATGHEDMRKCHEASRSKQRELHAKRGALRRQHLDEKIKKLQETKEKLESEKDKEKK